jgi:hypothetical protein
VGVVAVGAWAMLGTHSPARTEPSPTPPSAPEPAPVATEVAREPEPPQETIELIVSPAEAVALIDGRRVTPQADGRIASPVVPDDTTVHELRVEARGFRSRAEDLRIAFPQRIVIVLDPGTGLDDRRDGHLEPSPRRVRMPPSHADRTPEPSAPPLLTTEEP